MKQHYVDVVANDKYVEIDKHSYLCLRFTFGNVFKDCYKASKIAVNIHSGITIDFLK
ncbi:hypothetical protein DFR42_101451 [Undibacterium pigrum]|uniref:Uncharacterized protein n=1 Tax=Undibacterium pigrum TaxID=401470 RepID=A0A318JGH8_9BURK|nr:hypothetical protein DFR42_101451 [Undibacterium pigrum]